VAKKGRPSFLKKRRKNFCSGAVCSMGRQVEAVAEPNEQKFLVLFSKNGFFGERARRQARPFSVTSIRFSKFNRIR
jgi:hypothetical protein